jgi:serine/threonine-protein kinase
LALHFVSVPGTPYGRYELIRKIAAGGMAEVFLARRRGEAGFFRDAVVKRLFDHLAENDQVVRMFQYEARLLAELCHPNIPQVTDLGMVDGSWYIAMEYVEGHNVADLWRAGARAGLVMSLPVAVAIVMQVCEALHHAHERRDRAGRHLQIVHRDVTPHNVMTTRDGVAKLMDFGVAQTAARRDTDVGVVKGTFSYMAPEQVRGQVVDRRADVFALGVILYELTTGTRLFRGNDVQAMTAIVEHDAPLPSERVPTYPRDLEAIVVRALARDRRKRYATAAEVARDLEAFAITHGMLVGPRTVADYFGSVFPAERVEEEELALVEPAAPDPEGSSVAAKASDEVLEPREDPDQLDTGDHRPAVVAPDPVDLDWGDDSIVEDDVLADLELLSKPLLGTRGDDEESGASGSRRSASSEDESGSREDGEYVRDLARRLEMDGDD